MNFQSSLSWPWIVYPRQIREEGVSASTWRSHLTHYSSLQSRLDDVLKSKVCIPGISLHFFCFEKLIHFNNSIVRMRVILNLFFLLLLINPFSWNLSIAYVSRLQAKMSKWQSTLFMRRFLQLNPKWWHRPTCRRLERPRKTVRFLSKGWEREGGLFQAQPFLCSQYWKGFSQVINSTSKSNTFIFGRSTKQWRLWPPKRDSRTSSMEPFQQRFASGSASLLFRLAYFWLHNFENLYLLLLINSQILPQSYNLIIDPSQMYWEIQSFANRYKPQFQQFLTQKDLKTLRTDLLSLLDLKADEAHVGGCV